MSELPWLVVFMVGGFAGLTGGALLVAFLVATDLRRDDTGRLRRTDW